MTEYQRRLIALVGKLSKLTAADELSWRLRDGKVFSVFKSGEVELRWDHDENGQDAVRVTLSGPDGENLSFDDTALSHRDSFSENVSYYSEMEDLISTAFRSARGEDKVLNSFLNELEIDLSQSDQRDDIPF